jgi:hypothetical protein
MTLAIMQPYFFPYLGYYALIKHSDHFILFDTPQFIRHGCLLGDYEMRNLPIVTKIAELVLCLPIFPEMLELKYDALAKTLFF